MNNARQEAETVRKGLEKTNTKTTVKEITGALHTKRWKKQCRAT